MKSDDGNPAHGNLSSIYDDFADKIADAQNATLEYQDEMKVQMTIFFSLKRAELLHCN